MLEERYIVLKKTDLRYLESDTLRFLDMVCDRVHHIRDCSGKAPIKGVFIEADWPEYEPTVKMLEQRINNTKE